jgi:disulfide bond formation protein DsbB
VRQHALYTVVALAVLALAAVPIGIAVFVLGFVYGDSPCVMCWEQRIGMALVALVGLFVLRYGPRPKYIGTGVIIAAWGLFMAVRHTALHAARDIGQGFSIEILGAHTYTWAVLIFWIAALLMGLLLKMMRKEDIREQPRPLGPLGTCAAAVFTVVIAANIVQAFASTGPPPFLGQSDPVRFSFSPRHWVWSTAEWRPAPVSLRGRWAIDKPDLSRAPADPARGPIAGLQPLPVARQTRIGFPLNGTPTDLAFDPDSSQFLVTTQHGVYVADRGLSATTRYTIVDPGYSVDLGNFAGAAFLDRGEVLAVGENKSFVVLRPGDGTRAEANFRYFLESAGAFDELSRSRFGTVRARMMYIQSAAFDPATRSIYTVTVPNNKVKRLVVSRFDRRDMTLSEEFSPALAPGSGLKLMAGRTLDELAVTGAAVADGSLYLVSAAYDTLLQVDPVRRLVTAAWAVPALAAPTGLAAVGGELYIVGRDGRVWVVARPAAG